MRMLPALALLGVCACSGAGEVATPKRIPDAGAPEAAAEAAAEAAVDGATCSVAACASAHAECGQIPDGCGGVVDCGTCPAGQFCGGGGPNLCGAQPCKPATCASLGYDCGSVSDGCSKTLTCGTCQAPESCGGGGQAHRCGCAPVGCGGMECGQSADGCGGLMSCGTCGAGQICTNHVCCAATWNTPCTKTCYELQGPVLGYSQFEEVWCNGEGQTKANVTDCSAPDPDPCTTHGDPPDCGLVPGYSWCTVTCHHYFNCAGIHSCDGSCA